MRYPTILTTLEMHLSEPNKHLSGEIKLRPKKLLSVIWCLWWDILNYNIVLAVTAELPLG